MFTRPIPSSWQILFSIWPRFDAAAVCTSALWPSRFIVSVMPSAVSGLTNHEAPSAAVVPAGRGWQSVAFRSRYCAYIAPPIIDTVLPSSACAASDELALITVPAPSLPTGIAWSRRGDDRQRLLRHFGRDLDGGTAPRRLTPWRCSCRPAPTVGLDRAG